MGVGGGGTDLTFPEMQGRLHSPGATSCGGCTQVLGKPDGAVAPSPVSVDQCLVVQLADPRLASI
jgi:hypothetical protein